MKPTRLFGRHASNAGYWSVSGAPGVRLVRIKSERGDDFWMVVCALPESLMKIAEISEIPELLKEQGILNQHFPTRRDALAAVELAVEMS